MYIINCENIVVYERCSALLLLSLLLRCFHIHPQTHALFYGEIIIVADEVAMVVHTAYDHFSLVFNMMKYNINVLGGEREHSAHIQTNLKT